MRDSIIKENYREIAQDEQIRKSRSWMQAKSANGLRLVKFQIIAFNRRTKPR
jgi:hypothetical protein